jgi:hypothetical protein
MKGLVLKKDGWKHSVLDWTSLCYVVAQRFEV